MKKAAPLGAASCFRERSVLSGKHLANLLVAVVCHHGHSHDDGYGFDVLPKVIHGFLLSVFQLMTSAVTGTGFDRFPYFL
jgi:hypothetical protein